MAYTPTAEDFEEVESGQYKPTAADFGESENPIARLLSQGMANLKQGIGNTFNPSAPLEALRGTEGGLMNFGRAILNLHPHVAQMIGAQPAYQPISREQYGIEDMLTPKAQRTGITPAFEVAGETLPLLTFPLGRVIQAGAKIPQIIGGLARQTGILGALSPLTNPDKGIAETYKETFTDPALYAATAGLPLALMGGGAAASKLHQFSRLLGGKKSAEEVESARELLGGAKAPLGEIVGSPFLKRLQSGLSMIPGTGMSKTYENLGREMSGDLEGVLTNLAGSETDESVGDILSRKVSKTYKENRKEDSKLYKTGVEDVAREFGAKVTANKAADYAGKKYKILNRKLEEHPSSEVDPHLLAVLKDLAQGREGKIELLGGEKNKTIGPKSFEDVNALRKDYWNESDKAYRKGDKFSAGIWRGLYHQLTKDIEESAKNSGSPELYENWLAANKFHKEHVVPFERNKVLYQHVMGKGDPDQLVQQFLKTGQYERPKLLQDLTRHLNKDEIGKLTSAYMTKGSRKVGGETERSPLATLGTYEKLGDKVKDILFREHPEEKSILDSLTKKKQLFGGDLSPMFIPKTGYATPAQKIMEILKYAGTGVGAGLGMMGPAAMGPALHGLATGAGAIGAGNLMTRYLKSPWAIERYLRGAKQKPKELKLLKAGLSYPAYEAYQNFGGE